jgi:Secretion system C-terminal sorting domain
MKQNLRTLFSVFISVIIPIFLHGQTSEYRIDSIGTMGGHAGYYQSSRSNDTLYETDFMFMENGYVRWYAYEMSSQSKFTLLPDSTYDVKTDSMNVGNSWTSWIGQPTTAVVADTATITVPAGTFFTYFIKHYLKLKPDSVTAIFYYAKNIGWVKLSVRGAAGELTSYSIVGGSGYAPLAVGDQWNCAFTTPTDVKSQRQQLKPANFNLFQNYPNPFNPATNIEFTVPADGRATLKVYNILGQEVATLFDGVAIAGKYNQVTFDASKLANGIYFSRLEFGGQMQVKKMMLLK